MNNNNSYRGSKVLRPRSIESYSRALAMECGASASIKSQNKQLTSGKFNSGILSAPAPKKLPLHPWQIPEILSYKKLVKRYSNFPDNRRKCLYFAATSTYLDHSDLNKVQHTIIMLSYTLNT